MRYNRCSERDKRMIMKRYEIPVHPCTHAFMFQPLVAEKLSLRLHVGDVFTTEFIFPHFFYTLGKAKIARMQSLLSLSLYVFISQSTVRSMFEGVNAMKTRIHVLLVPFLKSDLVFNKALVQIYLFALGGLTTTDAVSRGDYYSCQSGYGNSTLTWKWYNIWQHQCHHHWIEHDRNVSRKCLITLPVKERNSEKVMEYFMTFVKMEYQIFSYPLVSRSARKRTHLIVLFLLMMLATNSKSASL